MEQQNGTIFDRKSKVVRLLRRFPIPVGEYREERSLSADFQFFPISVAVTRSWNAPALFPLYLYYAPLQELMIVMDGKILHSDFVPKFSARIGFPH